MRSFPSPWLWAAALLLAVFCVFAPGAFAADDVVVKVLPNGLRLLVRERHSAPLVAIDVWVRAGSGGEAPEESGAAHFLEHLVFKGTPSRGPGQVDAAIEDMGALLNAGTLRDGAHYYTTVASAYFVDALGVIGDALRNATLPEAEIEHERSVILDETARGRNDLHKQATTALYAALFAGSAYARPVLGEPAALSKIARREIGAFRERWYVPGNVTVVVVGDVAASAVEAAVERTFGDWAARALPSLPSVETPAPPKPLAGPSVPVQAGVPADAAARACTVVGYRTTFGGIADRAAADLLAALLADPATGLPARIPRPVPAATGRNRPAAEPPTVTVDFTPLRGGGLFAVYVSADVGTIASVMDVVRAELERRRREAPGADEIAVARQRVLGGYLYDTETFAGQARALGEADILGDYRAALDYADAVRRVTAADLLAFARRALDPSLRAETTVR